MAHDLDCVFPNQITKPLETHQQLKMITGVIETGLFINMVDKAIIATEKGIKEL